MTDDTQPSAPSPDDNNLVVRDAHGNPIPVGSRMIERESYERIIEGLKQASDAAEHLAGREETARDLWKTVSTKLDQVRRIAVQHAGLGLVMKEHQTKSKVSGDLMAWKDARGRFRMGLIQAAGGMRQLATCFRGDINWSHLALEVEQMRDKVLVPKRAQKKPAPSIILPPGYRQ